MRYSNLAVFPAAVAAAAESGQKARTSASSWARFESAAAIKHSETVAAVAAAVAA